MSILIRFYGTIEQAIALGPVIAQSAANAETLTSMTGTLERVGLVGQLLVFIWALYAGKLRWGKDYDKVVEERDAAVKVMQAYYTRIESKVDLVLALPTTPTAEK